MLHSFQSKIMWNVNGGKKGDKDSIDKLGLAWVEPDTSKSSGIYRHECKNLPSKISSVHLCKPIFLRFQPVLDVIIALSKLHLLMFFPPASFESTKLLKQEITPDRHEAKRRSRPPSTPHYSAPITRLQQIDCSFPRLKTTRLKKQWASCCELVVRLYMSESTGRFGKEQYEGRASKATSRCTAYRSIENVSTAFPAL